jgi:hypothetical protein
MWTPPPSRRRCQCDKSNKSSDAGTSAIRGRGNLVESKGRVRGNGRLTERGIDRRIVGWCRGAFALEADVVELLEEDAVDVEGAAAEDAHLAVLEPHDDVVVTLERLVPGVQAVRVGPRAGVRLRASIGDRDGRDRGRGRAQPVHHAGVVRAEDEQVLAAVAAEGLAASEQVGPVGGEGEGGQPGLHREQALQAGVQREGVEGAVVEGESEDEPGRGDAQPGGGDGLAEATEVEGPNKGARAHTVDAAEAVGGGGDDNVEVSVDSHRDDGTVVCVDRVHRGRRQVPRRDHRQGAEGRWKTRRSRPTTPRQRSRASP